MAPFAEGAAERGGEGPTEDRPWATSDRATLAVSLDACKGKEWSRVQCLGKARTGWHIEGLPPTVAPRGFGPA
jgi:hypothetical protein